MEYVDGFVAAVPTADREKYAEFCRIATQVFMDCGALSVVDCWGDDVPEGELTSFSKAVLRKESETVVFGWIVWPSKEARQTGMAKANDDRRLTEAPMLFDGKRMVMGGFNRIAGS